MKTSIDNIFTPGGWAEHISAVDRKRTPAMAMLASVSSADGRLAVPNVNRPRFGKKELLLLVFQKLEICSLDFQDLQRKSAH